MEDFLALVELKKVWESVTPSNEDEDEMLEASVDEAHEEASLLIDAVQENVEAFESVADKIEIVGGEPTDDQRDELEMLSNAVEEGWLIVERMDLYVGATQVPLS